MIDFSHDENSPAIVVPDVGGSFVDVYVDRKMNHHAFGDASVILLPFLDEGVFRGTDVSIARRVEMERHLIRTGLFSNVIIKPGAPGWLPVGITLNYNGMSYDAWLYYPNPYD